MKVGLKLSNVKILYKILACLGVLAAVAGGAIWYATANMKAIDNTYTEILEKDIATMKQLLLLQNRVEAFGRLSWRIIAETKLEDMKKTQAQIEANWKAMPPLVAEIKKLSPEYGPRAEQIYALYDKVHREEYLEIEKLTMRNENEESTQRAQGMSQRTAEVRRQIEALIVEVEKHVRQVSDDATIFTNRTITVTATAAGVAVAVVFALAFMLVQFGVARPISLLVGELKKISEGNFAVHVPGVGNRDEVGQIATAISTMADKVRSTISEVKSSAREVTNASMEISTSTTDLSQRTEEQAASLEETSASMEEISATVKKNAENAQQANASAAQTRQVADRGGAVVAKAVGAMAKIEESSQKIGDIIGVIDEIARQTNLLALNAAVEAARAGEAGRGFAVVASEVRSLAQRSSQAAKDIKDLITNSNSQVKDGVDLVNQAGTALGEIVESIKTVAAIVNDIANASIEQSTGIEQVNRALNQMDEVTQQNSALVEENAATAKTLEHQAKSMDEQVAFFQIDAAAGAEGMTHARVVTAKPVVAKAVEAKVVAVEARADVKPVEMKKPVAAPKRAAAGGGARRMQTQLATAIKEDTEWKEF